MQQFTLMIIFFCSFCMSTAAQARTTALSGGLPTLVDAVIRVGYTDPGATFDFRFLWKKKSIPIKAEIYDSTKNPGAYDQELRGDCKNRPDNV